MAVQAGRLRHRITFETPVETPNSFGEPIRSWNTFASRWAAIEPLQGREFWAAQQVNAEVSHRIRLRWLDNLSPTMRITFSGRVFEIASIRNLTERNREIEIMANERVD